MTEGVHQGGRVRRSRTFAAANGSDKHKTAGFAAAVSPSDDVFRKAAQLSVTYNLRVSLNKTATSAGKDFPSKQVPPRPPCDRKGTYHAATPPIIHHTPQAYIIYLITSTPIYGLKTSGTVTLPSAF